MEKAVIRNMSQIEYLDLRSKIIAVTEHEMFSYSIIERKAYAEAAYFLLEEASIQNTDILAGNLKKCHFPGMYPRNVQEEIEYLNSDEKRYLEPLIIAEKIGLFTRCPGAHVVPAYDALINEGLQNRINRVKKYFKNCIAEDSEKKNFYKAEMIVLRAMQHRILNYAKEAERLYKDTDDDKFKHIQNACEYIAYDAPKTFFEAIQLVLLAHECLLAEGGSGSMSFGRMDQYLFPYYEKDLCEGRITRAEAESIITAFWKKIAQYELSWQNVTLGGCDKNGKDMCNDLTILCMNASLRVRGDQPQISLRVHKNMPEHVWEKAFELIQTGMGFPEIYNDEVAVKAKMNAGVSEEDAWDYSIVGCVELSAGGKEYSHTEGARFNWLKILELMLNRGGCLVTGLQWKLKEEHCIEDINSFQELYEWYKRELAYFTKYVCNAVDILSEQYSTYWPVPYLSSMMQGCLEKGKDVTESGTIYNNLTLNCVGIASVADSLEAIETLVFKDQIITLEQLKVVLNRNFAGYETVQRKMLNCAKYGNDILSVDKKVADLTEMFTDILTKEKIKYRTGTFQAGFYTSYFHASFGRLTGASADGRMAREALSSSLSPMAGMDMNGPTAVINSANHINMERFSNGMVLDLKFTNDFLEKQTHQMAVQMLIEEYFAAGGLEIQFNVLDRETLLAAQKNPGKYKNLIVRVSGFSAYFVCLEEALQNEIIRRTEHKF